MVKKSFIIILIFLCIKCTNESGFYLESFSYRKLIQNEYTKYVESGEIASENYLNENCDNKNEICILFSSWDSINKIYKIRVIDYLIYPDLELKCFWDNNRDTIDLSYIVKKPNKNAMIGVYPYLIEYEFYSENKNNIFRFSRKKIKME